MNALKPIVVGVDFSENSRNAVKEAARLARSIGTQLHVVHIVTADIIEDQHELYQLSIDETLDRTRAQLEEFCEAIMTDPAKVAYHAFIGHPYHDLISLIQESDAGMLVMGSRGTSTESHHTGAIATQCARHAPVPVLLVRKHQLQPFKKITACVDFSDESQKALALAAIIAAEEGASLDAVHVHYPPWLLPRNVLYNLERTPEAEFREKYQELLDDRFKVALAKVREAHPELKIEPVSIAHANVHYGICEHLRESGSDLVVIGSHGHTRIRDLIVGSTAERLIRQSPCSILISRLPKD